MTKILDHVADRQAVFSQTANGLKRKYDRVRIVCFGLAFGGALLAAVASGLTSDNLRPVLAWPAALMLATSTFMTARYLTKERTALHVWARMASEALKREAYLYATQSGDYEDSSARDDLLAKALDRIEQDARNFSLQEVEANSPGSCPRFYQSKEKYVENRLDGQVSYYRKRAKSLKVPVRRFGLAETILVGAAAGITAIAASIDKGAFDVASLTAVITTLAVTILSHIEACKYEEQISNYTITANRLEALKAAMSGSESATEIALRVEDILTSETKSWKLLWLRPS